MCFDNAGFAGNRVQLERLTLLNVLGSFRVQVFPRLFKAYMGVSKSKGYLNLGVLIIRILLFRVLYQGPLLSETPICVCHMKCRAGAVL